MVVADLLARFEFLLLLHFLVHLLVLGSPLPPRYRFRELLMGATTDTYNTYIDDGERYVCLCVCNNDNDF